MRGLSMQRTSLAAINRRSPTPSEARSCRENCWRSLSFSFWPSPTHRRAFPRVPFSRSDSRKRISLPRSMPEPGRSTSPVSGTTVRPRASTIRSWPALSFSHTARRRSPSSRLIWSASFTPTSSSVRKQLAGYYLRPGFQHPQPRGAGHPGALGAEFPVQSGIDPDYVSFVEKQIVKAIKDGRGAPQASYRPHRQRLRARTAARRPRARTSSMTNWSLCTSRRRKEARTPASSCSGTAIPKRWTARTPADQRRFRRLHGQTPEQIATAVRWST